MSIKRNEFGEVISVNGITTGQHLGKPMQDAAAQKPEDNEVYATEMNTVNNLKTEHHEDQPKPSGGGASSWNDLKDKPFGEETTVVNEPLNITWDGNTDGLVIGKVYEYSEGDFFEKTTYFKVSDVVFTDEQIKTATATCIEINRDGEFEKTDTFALTWDEYVAEGAITDAVAMLGWAAFVREPTIDFPECGIYFYKYEAYIGTEKNFDEFAVSLTTTEPVPHTKTVVHKLDKKYLPEGIGGGMMIIGLDDEVNFYDVLAAIYAGKNVYVRDYSGNLAHIINIADDFLLWQKVWGGNVTEIIVDTFYLDNRMTHVEMSNVVQGNLNEMAPPA